MEGRRDAREYYVNYIEGAMTSMGAGQFATLAKRCLQLTNRLHKKGAAKVEANDNERFTIYVELPEDKDKWIPIMVEIANEHPQKIFHLVEGKATVIKVAMVDGIREV